MGMTVREGDVHPVYWSLVDDAGDPIDLTGATVELHLQQGAAPAFTLPATVEGPPAEGRVKHELTGDLAAGRYALELEVTKGDVIMTIPTRMNDSLTVVPQIA